MLSPIKERDKNMKTICIKLIALVTILVTSSCRVHSTQEEFGPSRKQNVAVADYDEIDLSGGLQVVYAEGTTPKVTVEGPEKLIGYVKVVQKGKRLYFSCKPLPNKGPRIGKNPIDLITITIQSKSLRRVEVSGACDLKAKHIQTADDFTLKASGASDLELGTLQCAKAYVETTGASDIDIDRMACGAVYWQSSGASDIQVKNVESREFNAMLDGASELEASLTGVETIKAALSGASEADLKFNNCGTVLLSANGASNVDLSGTIRSLTKNVGTGSDVKEEKLTIGR